MELLHAKTKACCQRALHLIWKQFSLSAFQGKATCTHKLWHTCVQHLQSNTPSYIWVIFALFTIICLLMKCTCIHLKYTVTHNSIVTINNYIACWYPQALVINGSVLIRILRMNIEANYFSSTLHIHLTSDTVRWYRTPTHTCINMSNAWTTQREANYRTHTNKPEQGRVILS